MVLTNTASNVYPYSGPCIYDNDGTSGPFTVTQLSNQYTNTLTIGSNQTIIGSITNTISNDPEFRCSDAVGSYNLTITNGVINNCECCTLDLTNTTPPQLELL
jgi:hypothetical protein